MEDERTVRVLSAQQLRDARRALGLTPTQLAQELGLGGRDPGLMIVRWERGEGNPTGPCSRLVQAMLAGFRPSEQEHTLEAVARLPGAPSGR